MTARCHHQGAALGRQSLLMRTTRFALAQRAASGSSQAFANEKAASTGYASINRSDACIRSAIGIPAAAGAYRLAADPQTRGRAVSGEQACGGSQAEFGRTSLLSPTIWQARSSP